MDQANEDIGKITRSIAAVKNSINRFEQIKTSTRQEAIEKLSSLLTISYDKAAKAKQAKIQQKWIAMCGYISQVLGRIVTDLEYERLRSDVEKFDEPVDENVTSTRTTIHRIENKEATETREH